MKFLLEVRVFRQFIASMCLAVLFTAAAQAETLLETVNIPKRSPFGSSSELQQNAAEDTAQTAEEAQADSVTTDVKEYQIGSRTVREYYIAGQLQYVEITSEGIPSYVFDYKEGTDNNGFSSKSGIRISSW